VLGSSPSITIPSRLSTVGRVHHAPGVHQKGLQRRVPDVAESAVAPLGAPAIRELEHTVALVEADDADRVPAQVFTTWLGHRHDATRCIHEALMDHHAGDE